MDDDPLPDPAREQGLHRRAHAVGQEVPGFVARVDPGRAAALDLVHNGVVGIAERGHHLFGEQPGVVAHNVNGRADPRLLNVREKARHHGAEFGVVAVEPIQEQNVADVEHFAIERGDVHVVGREIRVGAAVMEEGPLPRLLHVHHVAERRRNVVGNADAGTVDAVFLQLVQNEFPALVPPDAAENADRDGTVHAGKIDGRVEGAAAHGAGNRQNVGASGVRDSSSRA